MPKIPKKQNKEPSIEVLRIAVEEQRRFHDELTSSFRDLRTKILYFIGVILALMTFLYAGNSSNSPQGSSTADRLFIPHELYGLIFYFVGLTCLFYALAKLIHGARPGARWHTPLEQDELASLKNSNDRDFLEHLKNEYVKSTDHNLNTHAKKNESIRDSFYPLLIGAIILVVLRYFQ